MKMWMPILITGLIGAAAIGWWFKQRSSGPFTGFEGHFACEDFGLPDKNYNVLRMQMVGDKLTMDALFKSQSHPVGRLELLSPSLARLDLDTILTHSPNLSLNPLAEHMIEGRGDRIEVVGRREGKDLYRFRCSRTGAPY